MYLYVPVIVIQTCKCAHYALTQQACLFLLHTGHSLRNPYPLVANTTLRKAIQEWCTTQGLTMAPQAKHIQVPGWHTRVWECVGDITGAIGTVLALLFLLGGAAGLWMDRLDFCESLWRAVTHIYSLIAVIGYIICCVVTGWPVSR